MSAPTGSPHQKKEWNEGSICIAMSESDDFKSERQWVLESLKGFQQMFEEMVSRGREAYLLTFMFNELPGNDDRKLDRMKKEIERFYGRLATRSVRDTRSNVGQSLLPKMAAFPDRGTHKHKKKKRLSRMEFTNDGIHYHSIMAVTRQGCIRQPFDEWFEDNSDSFYTPSLQVIDVEPIIKGPGFVTDYAAKSLKRMRFTPDDVVLRPLTRSQLEQRLSKQAIDDAYIRSQMAWRTRDRR